MIENEITEITEMETFQKGPLWVGRILTKTESPQRSVSLIILQGENRPTANRESSATYIVLAGTGQFLIGDGESAIRLNVTKGSVVNIPANTKYQDNGNLVMLSTNCPAFDQDKVIEY